MSMDECEAEMAKAAALAAATRTVHGEHSVEFRDARALEDRWRKAAVKQRARFGPAGVAAGFFRGTFAAMVTVVQLGQAFFVATLGTGEPYQILQREVRARCPGQLVTVAVLCNQST